VVAVPPLIDLLLSEKSSSAKLVEETLIAIGAPAVPELMKALKGRHDVVK